MQVDPKDLGTMTDIAGDGIETHLVPDVDHTLRSEEAETSSPSKYTKQVLKPLDTRVTTILTEWLSSLDSRSDSIHQAK